MLILIGGRILLTNLNFQSRNAKITRFWNRVKNWKKKSKLNGRSPLRGFPNPPILSSEEALAYNKGRKENCYHVYNFNQGIECRPCSVLERISYRISDYCNLVSFRAFSPVLSIFNQLFCIVPSSPSVVHHKGEHKPYYDESYKKPFKSFRTQEESHQQGHKYSKKTWHYHFMECSFCDDINTSSVFRF